MSWYKKAGYEVKYEDIKECQDTLMRAYAEITRFNAFGCSQGELEVVEQQVKNVMMILAEISGGLMAWQKPSTPAPTTTPSPSTPSAPETNPSQNGIV